MADKEGPVTVENLPITFQDNLLSAMPLKRKNFASKYTMGKYKKYRKSVSDNNKENLQPETPSNTATRSSDCIEVKYLGQSDARGLWGIKHTRKPVDLMVAAAKALPPGQVLPIVRLIISVEGVHLETLAQGGKHDDFDHMSVFFNIESISYGVQDLVYTRVFSMIIVKDNADVKGLNPFECHGFVCESRNSARRLTYALAAAFQDYSRRVKEIQANPDGKAPPLKKKFAIDLRTPEEIEADLETEA